MFGFGSWSDSMQRVRIVNWRVVGLYGLALIATVVLGWAISLVG